MRPRTISHPRLEIGDFGSVQLREGKALPAKVFQRCTDQIENLVVDDEKSVMEVLACAYGQNPNSLRKFFLKKTGMTLSAWRSEHNK
jgi:methylphosphotriester-DNA--protein-cysteine methyltransferase